MSFKNIQKLILSSGSPRRQELIAHAGIPFGTIKIDAKEHTSRTDQEKAARALALSKMRAALKTYLPGPGEVIVTADTSVWVDRTVFGKPRDIDEARSMLRTISGRSHQVVTGVSLCCLLDENGGDKPNLKTVTFDEVTDVHVAELSEDEIEEYVLSGDPMDKAGAYGIQGDFSVHISRLEGDYFNVVGLPVAALYRELKKLDAILEKERSV